MALVRGRGPGVSTDMVTLAAELLRRPCEDHDQDRVDPHITWAIRLGHLAADHDRIVAEAEARGWNAGLKALDDRVASELERLPAQGPKSKVADTLLRASREVVQYAIAALRKPEVEG